MNNFTLSRREFLSSAAIAGGVLMAGRLATAAAVREPEFPPMPPVKIHKIFIGRTGGYMARPTEEIQKLNDYLSGIEKKLGNVQFIGGETVPKMKVDEVVASAAGADAILIIYLSAHGGDAPIIDKIVGMDKPTVLFFQPFGGHGWMYFHEWKKPGSKLLIMSTSDWSELDKAVALLRVPVWMKQSRIIAIGGPRGTKPACDPAEVKCRLGTDLLIYKNDQILELMKAIDPKAAEAEAKQYWIKRAKKIIEPPRDEIVKSSRMYLAIRDLMIREKVQAVTSSHCMGNPRGCLTFSKLCDLGRVGACEGDIDSTITMLMFAYAFGAPGFISDPVVDVSKDALIHFHCTSATQMKGTGSKRLPFTIRDQTDTKGGVALEVRYPIDQDVTCAKFINLDTMLCSTGKIIGTSTDPNACRTQFTTKVKNAQSMLMNWGGSVLNSKEHGTMTMLHRAVFFGDHSKGVEQLADLMGFKVIEEGA
jgi:hypothetical protein